MKEEAPEQILPAHILHIGEMTMTQAEWEVIRFALREQFAVAVVDAAINDAFASIPGGSS
jgi:hypothetical protein